jgi:selenium metabolism protein YedF
MSRTVVDARKKPCPEPVIETRKALGESGSTEIEVIVDRQSAAENVARMARSMGCEVRLEDCGDGDLRVLLSRSGDRPLPAPAIDGAASESGCGEASKVAFFIAADSIGRGDDDLGRALMLTLVSTLKDLVPRPTCAAFMNAGVKLTVEGSSAVQALRELEQLGVELLICGTCLDFYGLEDKLAVGQVSNMLEIASRLVEADRVVRP